MHGNDTAVSGPQFLCYRPSGIVAFAEVGDLIARLKAPARKDTAGAKIDARIQK